MAQKYFTLKQIRTSEHKYLSVNYNIVNYAPDGQSFDYNSECKRMLSEAIKTLSSKVEKKLLKILTSAAPWNLQLKTSIQMFRRDTKFVTKYGHLSFSYKTFFDSLGDKFI